jgi:hypothetical protein
MPGVQTPGRGDLAWRLSAQLVEAVKNADPDTEREKGPK